MKPCGNCGKDFVGNPRDAFCMPCELEVQAREPPGFLRDMRHVYNGGTPVSDGQLAMKAMMEQNPKEFVTQLRGAEKDYREVMKKFAPVQDQAKPCAVDESSERIEELIGRLLGETADRARARRES